MKKIYIRTRFRAEGGPEYTDQRIWPVCDHRVDVGNINMYAVDNDVWIREMGVDKFVTDWTNEEVWGRVEEVETDDATGEVIGATTLGFTLLQNDRKNGIIYSPEYRDNSNPEVMSSFDQATNYRDKNVKADQVIRPEDEIAKEHEREEEVKELTEQGMLGADKRGLIE